MSHTHKGWKKTGQKQTCTLAHKVTKLKTCTLAPSFQLLQVPDRPTREMRMYQVFGLHSWALRVHVEGGHLLAMFRRMPGTKGYENNYDREKGIVGPPWKKLHKMTIRNLKAMHRKRFNAECGHLTIESEKKGGNKEAVLEPSSCTYLFFRWLSCIKLDIIKTFLATAWRPSSGLQKQVVRIRQWSTAADISKISHSHPW